MTNRRNRQRRSFLPVASKWLDSRRKSVEAKQVQKDRKALLSFESLEQRLVLSTIIWNNRGDNVNDFDGFNATYGANAQAARAIVDRAIDDWQQVIENFNYPIYGSPGTPFDSNTYLLTVSAADLGGGGRGVTNSIATDVLGKPYSAAITLDDDGGGANWYFDPTPSDDAEFTSLLNQFSADGSNALGGNDFYRTIVHEMGHAMGISVGGTEAINNLLTVYGVDPVDGVSNLYLFQGATVTASLTDNGGGHIYEGPSVGGNPVHPFDLMNAGRTVGFPPPTRELITDLNAQILADAYNYTIVLPSTINSFYANLNSTTGVLTINGAPGAVNDQVSVDYSNGLRVNVNGVVETFPGANIKSIQILTGDGNDHVSIAKAVGIPVTANLGNGNDVFLSGGGVTNISGLSGDGNDVYDVSNMNGPASFLLPGDEGADTIIGTDWDDTFVVDYSTVLVGGAISIDGRGGFDRVSVISAGIFNDEAVIVGPDGGSGRHTLDGQTIQFTNIEPFTTNVVAANFSLTSVPGVASLLNGNNSITLSDGQILPNSGRITVDAFEPIEFSNKTTVSIDAGNGDDVVDVALTTTPAGLTGINVDGGAPGASDTLIVEAVPGSPNENVRIQPTAQGAGVASQDFGVMPAINYAGIEQIRAVLQLNEDDGFSIDGTTGDDLFLAQVSNLVGATTYTGVFDQNNATGAGPFTLPTIVVAGDNPAVGALGLFNTFGNGGSDELRVTGTDQDDQFVISEAFGGSQIDHSIGNTLLQRILFVDSDFSSLTVDMAGGSDQVRVIPELEFNVGPNTFPVPIAIMGGGSDDRLLVDESARTIAGPRTYNVLPLSGNNQRTAGNITGQDGGGNFTLGLTYEGIEQVQLVGDGDDTLSVRDDGQDSVWTLSAGPTILLESGRIGINDRSPVDFESFRRVELENTGGVDRFIVSPDRLPAFSVAGNQNSPPAEYQVIGGNTAGTLRDMLQIDGTGRDDAQQVVLTSTAITLGRTVGFTDVAAIEVNTGDGDDSLEVDTTGGFVAPHVIFDGGSGQDTLLITAGSVADEVQFYSGPVDNTGRLVYEDALNAQLMQIDYANLEPVLDNVAAATLTVFGTGANNSITYTNGPGGLFFGLGVDTGLVQVDGFESIEFANKATLAINGGNGDDIIEINGQTTPQGLVNPIQVNGGDPTASDKLIVNAQAGVFDPMVLEPTAVGAGTVVYDLANLPNVVFTGIEGLTLVGQESDADPFGIDGTIGDDVLEYQSGITPDTGSVSGSLDGNNATGNGPFALVPTTFKGMSQGSVLVFNNFAQIGGADSFVMNGTANSDLLSVSGAGPGALLITNSVNAQLVASLFVNNLANAFVQTGDGGDSVTVNGGIQVPVTVDGGSPAPGDVLTFVGTGNGNVTVDVAAGTIQEAGFSPVSISGFSSVVVNANLRSVNVLGTIDGDHATYQPLTATSGRLTDLMLDTTLDVINVRSLTVNGVAGSDSLVVRGTAGNDNFTTISDTSVQIAGLLGVTLVNIGAGDAIRAEGGAGNDLFVVPTGNLADVTVDGGGPAGVDTLQMNDTAFNVIAGPSADAGRVNTTNFTGIENLTLNSAGIGVATINGTGGADSVTVNGGAGGGTVSTSFGPAITMQGFAATSLLNLVTGAGADSIQVRQAANWEFDTVAIDGGDPWVGDSVAVIGTENDEQLAYTGTSENAGTLALTSGTTTTYNLVNVSSLLVDAKGAAGDSLNVTNANATIQHGFTPGSGTVNPFSATGSALLGLYYSNVETAVVTATTIVVDGTAGDDTITVSPTGIVTVTNTLGFANSVDASAATRLVLNTLGGNDSVTINPSGLFLGGIDVIGGEPGAGSDSVTVSSANPLNLALFLFNTPDQLFGAVGGPVSLNGVETLNAISTVDDNQDVFQVFGYGDNSDLHTVNFDAGDLNNNDGDVFVGFGSFASTASSFRPTSISSATVTNANGPTINVSDFNNGATNFFLVGPTTEELTVLGTAADETIDLNGGRVTLTPLGGPPAWVQLNYGGQQSLVIAAGAGDDTINVTTPTISAVKVDGGDPIQFSDTLNILAGADAVSYMVGPESDEGAIQVGAFQPISFDHIEAINITGDGTGTATIIGTNADNDITVTGTGTNDFTVSVDGGPAVQYTDFAAGVINGMAGDDDIDIDVEGLTLTALTVNGGSPAAGGGDTVSITGLAGAGNDNAVYTPDATGSGGTFDVAGLVTPIQINTVENLVYSGENGDENLTIVGSAAQDFFVHTPGAAPDAGTVANHNGLALQYTNLGLIGSVTIDGAGGFDLVSARGTAGDDSFMLAPTTGAVNLTTVAGFHVPLLRVDAVNEFLILDGLDGNDSFEINANQPYSIISILGGSPGGSDTLIINDVVGAADNIAVEPSSTRTNGRVLVNALVANYSGVEHLIISGSGDAGDVFAVNDLTLGDSTWNVSAGPNGDLVQIGDRESIEYDGFDDVSLNNLALSSDLFRVAATTLNGFNNSFTVNGDGNDKLELLGTNNADTFAQTAANQFTVNGVAVDFNGVSTLQLTGGDGVDTVTADISILAGGVTNLVVVGDEASASGGLPGDTLNLTVGGSARVTQSTDAGSGTVDQAGAVTVNYTTLESLNIFSVAAGSTLTVRGTNGADNISVTGVAGSNDQVRVWINSGTVMTANAVGAANFATVDVQGRFGDDLFSVSPVVNVALQIEGNDPTASDKTVINVTNDTIFAPTSSSDARVTVAGFAPITLVTMEGVTIGGGDAGVNLTIQTPVGVHTTTLTPGTTADSGSAQVESYMPMDFTNLGAGSIIMDDADSAANNDPFADDLLIYQGTNNDDVFFIFSNTGLVQLNAQIPVFAGDVRFLQTRGGDGSDFFRQVGGDAFATVFIEGNGPDDGDTLDLIVPTGAISVDLETSAVVGYNAAGTTIYSGLQNVNVDAAGNTLTLRASGSNDSLEVTPLSPNSGFAQNDDEDPIVSYFGVAANTLFVNLAAGDDSLTVHGSAAANAIGVDVPAGTVNVDGAIIDFNGGRPDDLVVNGAAGADTFTVVTGVTPVSIDGGSPIGAAAGDRLILNLAAAAAVLAEQGPESDEGVFTVGANAPLSFDHIEGATVNGVAGAILTVLGTNADDDITVTGNGNDDFTVSVNAGPAVQYNDFSDANLDGLAGDDDFDVAVNGLNGTAFNLIGGSPAVSGDSVTVTGLAGGADNAIYTPFSSNSGTLAVAGLTGGNAIFVTGVESLSYDGGSEDETLTVLGTAGADTIVHTPGAAVDSGNVAVNSLLPINYSNLGFNGIVALNGQGADDQVVARGTAGDDEFDVEATTGSVQLTTVLGLHVLLTRIDAAGEVLTLDGLDGNDTFTLDADQPYATVNVRGGSPGGSDLLVINDVNGANDIFTVTPGFQRTNGTVDVNAWTTNYTGVEHILLQASIDQDQLTINDDQADDTWTVNAGPLFGDRVQINDRETIDYAGFNDVTLNNVFGADVFRVFPTNLSGFANSFTVDGDGNDKLELVGTNNADTFTQTAAAQFTVNAIPINFLGVTTLQLTGFQSTDTFTADISTLAGGVTNLVVDGGEPSANNDTLNLTTAGNARITQSVDPQSGTVDNAGAVTVNYVATESLNIVTNTAGSTLLVRGTNNGEQIAIQGVAGNPNQGRVWIGAGTVITANNANANFATLNVQGRFGDDHFAISPIANVAVIAEGNDPTASDTTVVNVTSNTTFAPTSSSSAVITSVGFQPVTLQTMEGVTIGGDDGNRTLNVQTPAGVVTTTLTPGTTRDSGDVQVESLMPMNFTNLGLNGQLVLVDGDANDTFVYLGTQLNDSFTVNAAGLVNLNSQITVNPSQGANLFLRGLDGDDRFLLFGTNAYNAINVQGDGPDDGDSLTAVAPLAQVTVDLGNDFILGFGAFITNDGLASISVDAGGQVVNVAATFLDDHVVVTPNNATSGTVVANDSAPSVFYSNTAGNAVNIDLSGGEDTLTVVGNALSQTFDINIPGSSVRVDDLNNAVNDGIVTWVGNESLEVDGRQGDDTFNVIAGAIPLFIDGGDPIGQTAGDKFNMLAGGGPVIFEAGPENDEGGILIGTNARISYDHIEAGQVTDAQCIIVMGTNGDDDITVIARTQLANPLRYATADGNKDFTTTVNGGIEILWVNNNAADATVSLFVDGLSGDDDVVFRAPALNPANNLPIAWNVQAWVAGGSPSTVTGDQGDVFELGTPGQNRVQYTPTGYGTGVIQLDSTNGGVFDTTINLVENFVCDCDANGVNDYASSDGGFEQFNYDGEGGNDLFTVVDTVNNDVIVHTPGARTDEGSIQVNDMLAVNYEDLGGAATLTIGNGGGRADLLIAEGTGGSDLMTASRESAAIGRINVNSQLTIRTDGIEQYTLDGLEGDDHFVIQSLLAAVVTTVNVEGGGPGGSDSLEILGVIGAADTVAVRPGDTRTEGTSVINGVSVPYTGVEHLQLAAGNDVGDVLTVEATVDLGDNLWVVNAGDYGDRVQIDNRESIDYRAFDRVTLQNDFGTDYFRVSPTSLSGYLTSFTVVGDAFVGRPVDDVLELVGTPANDTVTSTATAVTINGRAITAGANLIELQVNTLSGNDTITLGLNLAGTRKVIDAGAGDDNVNVSTMVDATIFGGLGDDIIVGSPIADLIYGGSGNDTISGLGGNDSIYGDDGNDVITGGTGSDNLFGGAGSDRFIWNNGDNSDIVEGDEGVDVQVINGAGVGDNFLLRTKTGDESRAFFERTNLVPFTIDMGKVEQVDMNTGDGADNVEVRDLYTTDVTVVNTNVGTDVLLDTVTVQGRSVSDSVTLSFYAAINGVNIAGMKYDVNVSGLDPVGDADTLTFNANDGDDTVIASDDLSNVFGAVFADVNRLVINGGDGADSLTGFGNLNGNDDDDVLVGGSFGQLITGGEGDDQLYGGGGDDFLDGNAGEDTFVGGAGNDTIDGGDVAGNIEWDTILVQGTTANDTIDVNQTSATSVTNRVNADTQTDTLVTTALPVAGTRTVDEIRVEAGAGADLIRVRIADALAVDAPFNHLVTVVHGGTATAAGDRLVMVDDAVADLTLYRKGQDVTEGNVTIGPGNAEPFETVFDSIERVQFLDSNGQAINQNPDSTNSAGNPANRLVMFSTDMNEYNDDRFLSTQVGVPTTTTLAGTIDPGAILNPFGDGMNIPGDEDWFRVQANVTGTLDFQTMFDEIGTLASGRPGLPGNGDLDIYVYDADGTLIAGNGPLWGGNNGTGANPEINNDGDTFAENERIRIPAVQGQIYYLRVIGRNGVGPNPNALTGTINAFTLNVYNTAVAVPFDLELKDNPVNGTPLPPGQNDNSDTGRNQFDNHTYDNTPTIIFRLDDGLLLNDMPGNNTTDTPPDEVISIPFQPGVGPNGLQPTLPGYAIAIFDEGATAPAAGNAGNVNIRQPLGFATQLEPGLYTFTVPAGMGLNDGSHFITARVLMIDPANPQQSGWGARSNSFEIVVDRVAPPVFFGYTNLADTTHGLSASSDSGVNGYPATNVERVTNDTTPTFYGTGEANSIVRLYVETNGVAGLQSRESGAANPDLFIGLTVSNPLDGSNQFPAGNWELTSQLDLNNPNLGGFFTQDGVRRIYVTGEDLAGNITPDGNADVLNIFLDTRGPQVTRVDVNTRNNVGYNIWDHKGKPDGGNDGTLIPTPLVNSLVISVQDLPARSNVDPNFLYEALFTPVSIDPGQYVLVGDHNGIIPIQSITFTSDAVVNGQIATGFVTLSFFEPLPDDRFTLTLKDGITDRVGNKLDGEANTNEPHDTQGTLPSGDGVPGGNFVARFTVDSRAELGSWGAESAWVDTNGNFTFDPENADFVNRDIQYKMEWKNPGTGAIEDKVYTSDNVFAGKFTGVGAIAGNDGFDKLGAYGRQAGGFRWLIDTNSDGVADVRVFDPANINGVPVAGNFDGNAANGDEVGVFTGTSWWLDTNHDYKVDTQIVSAIAGYPIVGDFDGDGQDDLGTWQQDQFRFDFRANGFGQQDATINFGFIGVRERPVAADMDGDGIDDIGLWVPDNTAPTTAASTAEWYFLTSNFPTPAQKAAALGNANLLNHAFTPVPFGKDLYAAYGDDFAVPLIGNFDPPATTTGGTNGSGNQIVVNLDVNRDGFVTPLDALLIINALNGASGETSLDTAASAGHYPDVDGSGSVVPLDALYVINALNGAAGEGEGVESVAIPVGGSSGSANVAGLAVDSVLGGSTTLKYGPTPALIAQIVADDHDDVVDAIDSLFSDSSDEEDDLLADLLL